MLRLSAIASLALCPALGEPQNPTAEKPVMSAAEVFKALGEHRSPPPPNPAKEDEKAVMNRLISELKRSPRSYSYLRSIGFTQTDGQFDVLVTSNSRIFKPTRIVRRDEKGNRQIPGWPGVMLNSNYKR